MQQPKARTVAGLLAEMAERYPEREALVDARRRLTYRKLRDESRAFAKGLYALGVRRGDHVAILMGNVAEWLVVDFAIASLGATMVSINTWATSRELAYMLTHSDCSVLVFTDRFIRIDYTELLGEVRAAGDWPVALKEVVCLGETPAWATSFGRLIELGANVDDAVIDAAESAVDPNDIACLLYTSGSTSLPKGVLLQHFGLVENMWWIGERQHLTEVDRLWLAVSLFWALGCENALFAMVTHGGCIVLQESFDASEALRIIEQERCSVFYGTPNMTLALWEHPERETRDLSSLRTGVTIGKPEQIQMAIDLGVHEICNVYGMTEVYANSAITDAATAPAERTECVGKSLPGTEIFIVDAETGRAMGPGEIGEIRVRGYVTPGYYKDPEKNAEVFDSSGFFRTGDLGFLDEAGNLYFRGRLKEMIKTGGINVSPVEVEEILCAHDAVGQAYVVGLPDAQRDEIVAAVIVPEEGIENLNLDEIRSYCRERMAAYKVPRVFRIATDAELPLTSTRKLQKMRLPELFPQNSIGGNSIGGNSIGGNSGGENSGGENSGGENFVGENFVGGNFVGANSPGTKSSQSNSS